MQATTDKPTLSWEDVRDWAGTGRSQGGCVDDTIALGYVMAATEAHPGDTELDYALGWLAASDLERIFDQVEPSHRPIRTAVVKLAFLMDTAHTEQTDANATMGATYRTVCAIDAALAELGAAIAEWKLSLAQTAS